MTKRLVCCFASIVAFTSWGYAFQGLLDVGVSACPIRAEFGQRVTLAGLARGESGVTFSWQQLDAEEVVELDGVDTFLADFIAPDTPATLTFRLTVTGTSGQRVSDNISVEVSETGEGLPRSLVMGTADGVLACDDEGNEAAVATVPAVIRVESGVDLAIVAIGGRDPDDTRVFINGLPSGEISYLWAVTDGAGLLTDSDLQGATTKSVSFTAPAVTSEVTLILSLLVADVADCGTLYEIAVEVSPRPLHCPEVPPVALAQVIGVPTGQRVIAPGDEFVLDGSRSGIPGDEGSPVLGYSWRQIEGEEQLAKGLDSAQARIRADRIQSSDPLRFRLDVESENGTDEMVVTVPVSPLYQLFFSQIAYGRAGAVEFATIPVLINDSTVDATDVRVEFFDQAGRPLSLLLDGEPWDPGSSLALPAGSARQIAFSAADESFTVGWARVSSTSDLTGLVLYQLRDANSGNVNFELGLFSSQPGARMTAPYGRNDGLAMAAANPTDNPVNLRFQLLDNILGAGSPVATRVLVLRPGEQIARFLNESFLGILPDAFQSGTLVVEELEERSVVATVLKTDRRGLITSTLPLAVRRGDAGVIGINRPPVARLSFGLGEGALEPAGPDQIVPVTAPVGILLDAGTSSDDLGQANLSFTFSVRQNLTSGGAVLTVVSPTTRTLLISEGSSGSIEITLEVTDSLGESDAVSLIFQIS